MSATEIKITPRGPASFKPSELWRNRELLYFLTWRDIKVKYKQTYLGVLWVILQPLLMMAVFYIIFFRALNISVGMSYPVYTCGGLILWGLFSSGIQNSSESMLGSAQMIRKIYFPRILIPAASVLASVVDFFIAFLFFIVLLFIFRQPVSWHILYCFPVAIVLTMVSSFGLGALLSALNVKYRDFRYLLPFAMQFLFFSSQIVYSLHSLQKEWVRLLLFCNPLNGALELFAYPFRNEGLNITGVLVSSGVAALVLMAGLSYFKRTELYFADLI